MKKFSLSPFSYLTLAIYGGLLSWKCTFSSAIGTSYSNGSQLSPNFITTHYDIHLQVILNNSTFSSKKKEYTVPGKVQIVGKAMIPNNFNDSFIIVLQVEKLSINHSSVSVTKLSKQENNTSMSTPIPIKSAEFITKATSPYIPPFHLLVIRLELLGGASDFTNDSSSRLIKNGDELEVSIEYSARILEASSKSRDDGFVYFSYTSEDGELKKLVRAESIHTGFTIRKFFPSVQTVEYESSHTFQLTVVHEQNYDCISNTPLEISSQDPENPDWVHDRFSKSIQMPISMLSFVISDFSFVEAQFGNNKSVRVHAPEHILERANYTVYVAAKILSFLDDYLNSSFAEAVSKVDIVWGGENIEQKGKLSWGLYIDTERKLFPSPEDIDSLPKEFLPELLSYPLAFQYLGVNKIDPTFISFLEWKAIQNASLEGLILEERLDEIIACDRSEALFMVTEESNPFSRKFDTYCGTYIERWLTPNTPGVPMNMDIVLLTMLEQAYTPEIFKQIYISHLKKFDANRSKQFWAIWGSKKVLCEYLNTTSINLFHSSNILNVSQLDEILDTNWYYRSFPVVQSWKISDRDIQNERLSKNYTQLQKIGDEPNLYHVEIKEHIDLPNSGCNFTRKLALPVKKSEFLVGDNFTGYFRIMYDSILLNDIFQKLESPNFGGITPLKRAQLLDDHFMFAFITKDNGLKNDLENGTRIRALLNLTRYLDKETSISVWNIVLANLRYFEITLSGHPEYSKLQIYFRQKLDSALETFGFETVINSTNFLNYSEIFIVSSDNPWSLVNLRGNLLSWACKMGSEICKKIGHQFLDFWRNSSEVDSYLSILTRYPLATAAVLGVGNEDALNFCFEKIKHPPENLKDLEAWRIDFLKAVALLKDENVLSMTLNSTLEMSYDLFRQMLSLTAINPQGQQPVLNVFKASIKGVNGKDLHAMIEVLPRFAGLMEEQIVELEDLLKEHKHGMEEYLYDELTRKLNVTREVQENDLKWAKENGKHVFSWMTEELKNSQDDDEDSGDKKE